jgi:hypothetical protein
VTGTEILDLQVLELNMRNESEQSEIVPDAWSFSVFESILTITDSRTVSVPSAAAERFINLLEGRKETQSVGNNEILFAIKDTFEVNIDEVQAQLAKATEIEARAAAGYRNNIAEYCTVKLTRKNK